jgi:hypothetical protein
VSADPDVLMFHLPMPPNVANGRMHWRVKLKHRQQYERHLDALWFAKKLPRLPRTPWTEAEIAVQMRLRSWMDDDNAVARCKWPLDWLVKAGYLVDDKRKHLRWAGFPTQVVSRKLEPELTLIVRRVSPPAETAGPSATPG